MIEPKSRGVLDAPHARGMTAWVTAMDCFATLAMTIES
jgi:hypothetical protein